jgi:hypothetical protein
MSTEIFRFVTIRPPQQVDTLDSSDSAADQGLSRSPFIESLRKLRGNGSRASIVGAAAKLIGTAGFIDSSRKLDKAVVSFINALQRLPELDFWDGVVSAFQKNFDVLPADFIKSDAYTKPYSQVADSIVAAAIDGSVTPKTRTLLVKAAKALWLIRRLADDAPLTQSTFISAPLVLPSGIFPLPAADVDLKGQHAAQVKQNKAALAARQKQMTQLTTDLVAHRQAATELLSTFELSGAQPAASTAARVAAGAAAVTPAGFLLSEKAANALSTTTKNTLKNLGVETTKIDVAKSVTLLEKQAATLASQLYADTGTAGTMVRIGNLILPNDAIAGGFQVVLDPGQYDNRSPGPCPPMVDTTPPNDSVTVPVGQGDARILGIADLMVLEQNLLRYQLGEIAHIENVLKSEVRSRKYKTTDTISQTQTTETETTTDKEQDLSSAERFELQTESQTVINTNASKDAGLTIHASYGPSVDATANYNTTSSTSTTQSNTASSSYAREITTKAVDRVQTRTLTSRTVSTINVIEEINEHAFDNKEGSADIVGVYRYVDKIYQAQVVNYGKRLMLEFIVPEPAAFLRYALTHKPVDNVSLVNPEPPGYCLANGMSFAALQVSDITRDNYMYWAGKYGAQDVTPPPPSAIIASGSKKAPDQMPEANNRFISSDIFDVTIADGYLCQSAFINIYGETQLGTHKIMFQLQEQQGLYIEPTDDNHTYYLHLQPTPTLTITINSLGFYNYEILATVFCTLSTEKFQEWQLKTYSSIMNAYQNLKSSYDQAIQEARLQADNSVGGTNPANNRITEQTELKKGCISLLTGQRFELFDAVNRNVAPHGYPEIDFAEAKAEGAYIQMFEQSFEWNNMVYLFYPYFWGKKDDWVTIAQLTDDDPLFGQFLQAGAARVQVPVRLGFESGILTYLSTGETWPAEGTLVNSDGSGGEPQHLSIIDELKSQTGNNNIEGVGTISVTKNSVAISGSGTQFTQDDENKRIVIGSATYVIKHVQDAQTISLTSVYTGDSATGLGYALGGKLVGQPWEVKLPTNLVKLDNSLVFS